MFVPLICAYILFAWIQSYNDELQFEEYIESTNSFNEIKQELLDPTYYAGFADYKPIEEMIDRHRSITLYNKNGLILYTSDPSANVPTASVRSEELYEGLYRYQQGYRSFSYKEPVFANNEIVGFFDISIARQEWTEGVVHRTYLVSGLMMIAFILIYITIVYLVNRKLNYRLTGLMGEMSAFARGEVLNETETSKDEIGELKRQFYVMRTQIVEARSAIEKQQKEKEYMIATLSHDLKTPLTSIRAYSEALEKETGLTSNEQETYNRVITEKTIFMKEMLDDLLTYTLLQSPTYEMDVVLVDGEEFFEMLVADFERLCEQRNIELHVDVRVSDQYEVHPNQMIRVVNNLVSNAIHHTPKHGKIWIGAFSSRRNIPSWLFPTVETKEMDLTNHMYLVVQNEGKGIPVDQLSDVFDPLFQVDKARTKKSDHGSGLGLSITKQIIEKHHGDIRMYSENGKGVSIICRLPKYM